MRGIVRGLRPPGVGSSFDRPDGTLPREPPLSPSRPSRLGRIGVTSRRSMTMLDRRARKGQQPDLARRSVATGAASVGAHAVGALALGAVAAGAVAIGRL